MRKAFIIVTVFAGLMIPAVSMAKGSTSVTIALSVYLSPVQPTSQAVLAAASSDCATPQSANTRSGNVQCKIQSTVYTWQKSSSGTTLLVAPI